MENRAVFLVLAFVFHFLQNPARKVVPRKMLTVVIPCWQCSTLVGKSLRSLASQSIAEAMECVVVLGSRSHALAACSEHAQMLDLRMVRRPAADKAGALKNAGARHSSTPFLAFLDAGDTLHPLALERLLIWHIHGKRAQKVRPIAYTFPVARELVWANRMQGGFHQMLLASSGRPLSFGIVDTSVFLRAGGFKRDGGNGRENLEFLNRLHRLGYKGQFWPEPDMFGSRTHLLAVESGSIEETVEGLEGRPESEHTVEFFSFPHWSRPKCDVLAVLPWLEKGGADEYDWHALSAIARVFSVCIITTTNGSQNPEFARFHSLSAEIWDIAAYARHGQDNQELLDYYMGTRQPRVVYVRNSLTGYGLSKRYSGIAKFVDVQHLDHASDDFVRKGAAYSNYLDARIVISRRLEDILGETEHPDRITLIPPPLNTTFWKCTDRRSKRNNKKKRLLFAGRFVEQKQPWVFAGLCEKYSEMVDCTMVGERQHERMSPPLGNIRVLEWMEPEALRKEMCASDALVLTSRYEGIPMVALQARSCGIKVAALKACRGAINEVPGAVIANSWEDIVPRLESLENPDNDAELELRFGIDNFEKDMVDLIAKLIGK